MVGHFRKHKSAYTRSGIPDLILVHRGKFVGFEVKTATGKQTAEQIAFQKDLVKNGGCYFLVRSIEDVENALREIEIYGK